MTEHIEYLNFDVEVEATATANTYLVQVISSPTGEASVTTAFPYSDEGLENVILKLGRTRSGVRALGSPTEELARKFGTALYDSFFAGEVGTCFRRSLDTADVQGKGLRVRLRLGNAPGLSDVPWEYLYLRALREFLVLSRRTPIVRYLDLPRGIQPLHVDPPLQVLLVVSAPTDLATLDSGTEVARVHEALAELEAGGLVEVTTLEAATLTVLRRALRRGTYHVLHFIGHGGFDPSSGEGMLAFEDDDRRAHLVSGSHLSILLQDHRTLRVALLNACDGARQSPADPFSGVAQALVQNGLPAVLAMQFEITDKAALTLSQEFYAAIADGYPIDAALAEARVAVFSEGNDVEWGTPVLYLRASDGNIFDLPAVARVGRDVAHVGMPADDDSARATVASQKVATTATMDGTAEAAVGDGVHGIEHLPVIPPTALWGQKVGDGLAELLSTLLANKTSPVPDGAMIRTPWLGLQLWQDEERVLFTSASSDAGTSDYVVAAHLKSDLFYIRTPRLGDGVAMQVCVWTDDSIFSLAIGQTIHEVMFFREGTGLADTSAGSSRLYVDNRGNNYLIGSRLESVGADHQQFAISRFERQVGAGLEKLPKPWGRVFATVLVDANNNGIVDIGEYEFLVLDFS